MSPDGVPAAGGEITRLLHAARDGDRDAVDRIMPLIYDDLRAMARRQLHRELGDRAMQPTSLVHEAYMKLNTGSALQAGDRAHFLAIAGRAMRQVLVDDARRRSAAKRGEPWQHVTLGDEAETAALSPADILSLDDAMNQLEPRQRQVVDCRFFGGMEEQEIAAALGVTERTVRRDWVKARAWLYRTLYDTPRD
ncbi:MAG: ECF-type sigma factor [Bacillota bacterium]|jgi:RNA polymerase sigma factor (TIGR02999 family)